MLSLLTKPTPRTVLEEPVGSPTMVSACECFVVDKHFREGIGGEVPIVRLGACFNAVLRRRVEENVPEAVLRKRAFLGSANDTSIIDALGGAEKAWGFLAHFYDFLKTADRGMHTRYHFYISGTTNAPKRSVFWRRKETLFCVRALWERDGWFIEVYPPMYRTGFGGDSWVIAP